MPHLGEWGWGHVGNILNSNGREFPPIGDNIQRAIDDLPPIGASQHGGTVWLPRAPVANPLVVTAPIEVYGHLNIIGQGINATNIDLADDVNDSMFKYLDAPRTYNFRLAYLMCHGNRENQTAGNCFEVDAAAGKFDDATFLRVGMMYFKENGFETKDTWGWQVYATYVEHCDTHGFYATAGGDFAMVGCKFGYCGQNGADIAAYNGRILGTIFIENNRNGLSLSGHELKVMGCTLTGNGTETVNTYDAIIVYGDENQIVGNTFLGLVDAVATTRYAVNINAGADGTVIDDYTIDGMATGDFLDGGARTTINGLGREAADTGVAPVAANWRTGDVVQNTNFPTEIWTKDYAGVMRRLA